MKQIDTRISRYSVQLRQEQGQMVKMKSVENGQPPEPEIGDDGQPIVETVPIGLLAFSDTDSPETWLFLADPDFRVEIIGVCAEGLSDEQRQAAISKLTGGIGIFPAGSLDVLEGHGKVIH